MISVWTGRNSGLDEDNDPLLLEFAEEGIKTDDDDDDEAEDDIEDDKDDSPSLIMMITLSQCFLTPHNSEVV